MSKHIEKAPLTHWCAEAAKEYKRANEAETNAATLLEALKIALVQLGEYRDGQGAAKFHAVNIAREAIRLAEGGQL